MRSQINKISRMVEEKIREIMKRHMWTEFDINKVEIICKLVWKEAQKELLKEQLNHFNKDSRNLLEDSVYKFVNDKLKKLSNK